MKRHVTRINIAVWVLALAFLVLGCADPEFERSHRSIGRSSNTMEAGAGATGSPRQQVPRSEQSSCWTCDGTGRIPCSFCSGGRMRCTKCNGHGRGVATYLKSVTRQGMQFGKRVETCLQCFGQGTIRCYWCSGHGGKRCSSCGGTGRN